MSQSVARDILDHGGFVGFEPASTFELAAALIGRNRIGYGDDHQREQYAVLSEPDRILLQPSIEDDDLNMALARAVVQWWCDKRQVRMLDPQFEATAVSLALPSETFRLIARQLACDVDAIARCFVVPAGIVALRLRQTLQSARPSAARRLSVAS